MAHCYLRPTVRAVHRGHRCQVEVLSDPSPDQRQQLRRLLAGLALGRLASANPPAGSRR